MADFLSAFTEMQQAVHENAKDKGWHDEKRTDGDFLALIHSEVSEALEAVRDGNPPSSKAVGPFGPCSVLEEELADVVIRVMDYAEARGLKLAQAIEDKHAFNKNRPHRHGGKAL